MATPGTIFSHTSKIFFWSFQQFRKSPKFSQNTRKFLEKSLKNLKNLADGGPVLPDRGVFPKIFYSGGYFGYTPCTPLVLTLLDSNSTEECETDRPFNVSHDWMSLNYTNFKMDLCTQLMHCWSDKHSNSRAIHYQVYCHIFIAFHIVYWWERQIVNNITDTTAINDMRDNTFPH